MFRLRRQPALGVTRNDPAEGTGGCRGAVRPYPALTEHSRGNSDRQQPDESEDEQDDSSRDL